MFDVSDDSSDDSSFEPRDPTPNELKEFVLEQTVERLCHTPSWPKPVLPLLRAPFSFDDVAEFVRTKGRRNVIVLVGAGVSTAAGIPDFRTPGTGLYSNLQKYNLPTPESVFDIGFFRFNPLPFYQLAKELYPGQYKPTAVHRLIKRLDDSHALLRCYTQNIDTLERLAGVDPRRVVEAHGSFADASCVTCRQKHTSEFVRERVMRDEVPVCSVPECGGNVKPNITFFGEQLPKRFKQLSRVDFLKCDLLLVVGTSLSVQPFASLVNRVRPDVPRVLVNMKPAGTARKLAVHLKIGDGMTFNRPRGINQRDLYVEGDCQRSCVYLARKLGFGADVERWTADGTPGALAEYAEDRLQTTVDESGVETSHVRQPDVVNVSSDDDE
jgi:NAD-dependent deacetylase sirtuin 2